MPRVESSELTVAKAKAALEEELEYSNVTDLRQGLLQVVDRLQRTPASRILIMKHGRPQAVLMSFQTYELVKKAMNQVVAARSAQTREESLDAALARVRAHSSAAAAGSSSDVDVRTVEDPEDVLEHIREGAVLTGRVKNLTDYGAFVDLGGVEGLLHITDMSWSRLHHPAEVVNAGDEIRVKVLKHDKEKRRISLGLKQLTPKEGAAASPSNETKR
jgi:predicted RNA-binding protein with RPS1 domain/PHD/YefM family antitoxin component YafN of YafNO toxin-antitoxin module